MARTTPLDSTADALASRPLSAVRRQRAVVPRWLAACLVTVLAVAWGPRPAIGQTWIGSGTTGNWNEAANWTSLPANGANLTFGGDTNTNTVNNLITNVSRFYFTNDGSVGKTAAFTITGNAVRPTVGDSTLFNTTAIATGGPITDEIALNFVSGLSSIGGATLGANHNLKLSGRLDVGGIGLAGLGGPGALIITNTANTWTGITGVGGNRRAEVTQLLAGVANASGTASSITIGQFGSAGTLVYIGAGESATKRFTFGNGTSGGSHTGGSNLLNNGTGTLAFTSGTFNIADNTAAARTLTLGGTSSLSAEIQGTIINNGTTGAAALAITKADSGTWILSGSNTYTGATRVNGGTLQLGNNGTTGWIGSSSSVILGSTSANLVFARTDDYGGNFDRVISGTGNIRLASGTLTLSATNTAAGTTRVDAGQLILTSTVTLQNSAFDTAGAGTLVLAGATPVLGGLAGATNLAAGNISGYSSVTSLTLNPGTGLSNTYSGAITDGAAGMALVKSGNGTQVLSGSNSYTGGTTLSAGRLDLNHANALGSGAVTISSGTLGNSLGSSVALATNNAITLGGNFAFAGPNDLDLGTGAVTMAATRIVTVDAGRLTISGAIASTSAGLTKSGSGTLRLTASNAYTGITTVNAGTLEFSSIANSGTASALGAPAAGANSTIALANAATLRYTGTGGHSSNRAINLVTTSAGTATLEAAGSGAVTLSGSITGATGSKTLLLTGTSLADNGLGFIANASSGTTSLLKQGAGRWVLNGGTSTFTGPTTVEEGELVLGADSGQTSGSLGAGDAVITIGTPTGSGTAALLLKAGVKVTYRDFAVPDGGSQTTVIGSADGSGTATFLAGTKQITLGRDVTLVAKTGGTMEFNNFWAFSSGSARAITVGSVGNAGTVVLGSALGTTGTVSVAAGTLRLASAGSLAAAAGVIVGTAGSSGAVLDVTPQIGTYSIGAAQTLGGIGTLQLDADTPVSIAGIFSPGNSPGLFTFDGPGSTTLSGTTLMEIEGLSRGVVGGYDAVNLTNDAALVLGGLLQLSFTGTFANDTPFQLFTVSGSGLTGSFSGVSVLGSFYSGLTWTQSSGTWTSTTTESGQSLRFSSATGTLVVVPEPATLALAAVGIGLAGWAAVRRRR